MMREYELPDNPTKQRLLADAKPLQRPSVVLKVMEEQEINQESKGMSPELKEFLRTLPRNTEGGRSKEEIDAWLREERESWRGR